jgi:hypothetical protein
MKLITKFELATKTKTELHILLRVAFETAVRNERHSAARINALASMQNIVRAIRCRKEPTP